MRLTHALLALTASAALLTTACDDDDPIVEENEEELITTVVLTLTGDDNSPRIFTFLDLDGEGGVDGTASSTGGNLEANTTYAYSLDFLNQAETPPEVVTTEIREEDEEHQVFFSASGVDLDFAYNTDATEVDDDGNPIGLVGTVTTGDGGTGTMTITLRHEPNKDAAGVSDGDITNAGGETDIQVVFDVEVED